MHTKESLIRNLEQMRIDPNGTLMVHSSFKSMGNVEGGPKTVLDALSEYMADGLLILPAHTWATIGPGNPDFNVNESPTCVGILTELFRKRPNVHRSWHPTHSVSVLGRDALAFIAGHERETTPCGRSSPYGKLLDRKGDILFLGVDLCKNTFIHGVEEWMDIPNRLSEELAFFTVTLPDGTKLDSPCRRHVGLVWSDHFWKINDILIAEEVMRTGRFGQAEARVCKVEPLTRLLNRMLATNPDLFSDNEPLELKWSI
jgi:aminoglycoside 3-N-acetyltransferase